MLTPTPVNAGERPDTLDRQNGPFQASARPSLNAAERTAVASTTAGCRFDSCPDYPSCSQNSSELQPHEAQPILHVLTAFDPI
jgi:hypothetical protein